MLSYVLSRKNYVLEAKGVIVYASNLFYEVTKFAAGDVIGKSTEFVFKELLRIRTMYDRRDIETCIFSKDYEVINVVLHKISDTGQGVIQYIFDEIPDSRFDQKYLYVKRLIWDNIKGVAVFTAPNFMLCKANRKFLSYLPKPYDCQENVYGRFMKEFVHNFEGSDEEAAWSNTVACNKTYHVEEKQGLFCFQDQSFWNYTLTPVEEDGKIKYVIVEVEDVTELVVSRKRIEDQANLILRQKELLDQIIENMQDAIAVYDCNGKVVQTNAEARRYYPDLKPGSEIENVHNAYDCFNEENVLINKEDLPALRVLKGEKIKNEVMRIKNHDRAWVVKVNAIPVLDSDKNLLAAVVSHHDITQEKEYEESLNKHKELLEVILDNSYENISVMDSSGNYIYNKNNIVKDISEQFPNLDEAFRNVKYYDINGNEISLERLADDRLISGKRVQDEIVIIKIYGKEYYLLYSSTPVYDKEGNLLYGIGYSRNLTEVMKSERALKEAQEKLLKAEQDKNDVLTESLQLKNDFLYLITHEFKTPLAVIKSAIQTMEIICKKDMTDKAVKYLNTITQNVNRQIRLVNNLLDITKINSGNINLHSDVYDIVFLTRSIVNSVQSIARLKKIDLNFITEIISKEIFIDEEKFERILLNLLSNAIKFTRQDKSINVSLYMGKYKSKNVVCISVQDQGIGIPQDKQAHIFERFGQANTSMSREAEGTGIGLYLVKLFVMIMGGHILLESKEGEGSNFIVMFPIVKAKKTVIKEEGPLNIENRLIQVKTIEMSDIYL